MDNDPQKESLPMDEDQQRRAFYTALLAAQTAAPNVAAVRINDYSKWPYASNADVLDVLMPVLNGHGLTAELVASTLTDELEQSTSSGGKQYRTDVTCTFRVSHAESGFSRDYLIAGRRTNDSDKGVMHATSSATKTFLLRLLGVSEQKNDEGEPGGAQPTVASRRTSGSKRQERRPPSGPPPNGTTPPATESSDEEKLEFAKTQVRVFMEKNGLKGYHLEAVIQVDKAIRADLIDQMDLKDWDLVHQTTRSHPTRFDEAMKHLAEEFPTSPERVSYLDQLVGKVKPNGKDAVLIEAAKHVGWNDAIEFWITKLESRARGDEG